MRFVGLFVFTVVTLSAHGAFAQLRINPYPSENAAPSVSDDFWQEDTAPLMPPQDVLSSPAAPLQPLVQDGPMIHAGSDVRMVLQDLSRDNGVDFIWDIGEQSFYTNRSLHIPGSYEDALRVILDQFQGHESRPVAKIYLENAQRSKTLVVSISP